MDIVSLIKDKNLLFVAVLCFLGIFAQASSDLVTIAILVKDKAHTLPLFLSCIEKQSWPAERTCLYIRTNNNNDNSAQMLKEWIEKVKDRYATIYFDDTDVDQPVQLYGQHEWNAMRFKVLGAIRQESVNWALKHDSHYFVIDCDNFIQPNTLEKLMEAQLPIVAPLLVTFPSRYSNYHAQVDANGYFVGCGYYDELLYQKMKGLFEVPVVHCTYLINKNYLKDMSYDDDSYRFEYIIFSDNARKKNVAQYLDNREIYGYLTFATNKEALLQEPWLQTSWLASDYLRV